MSMSPSLKLAWYGDDFTGATDTLATAARAGLNALLFLDLPTPAQLQRAGRLDCIGIAGAARAMTPAEMKLELEPVGRLFARLGASVMHYKTCSTFDSAPHIGSIGAALHILRPFADDALVPIVGGQPNLKRYCTFGNLFAAAGDAIHRIDRHPTMRQHPVTPMHEADLRLHLGAQGLDRIASISYADYAQNDEALEQQLSALIAQQPNAVLFDVSRSEDLATIGRLIWKRALQHRVLAAGPSSVVQALAAYWAIYSDQRDLPAPTIAPAVGPVLVLAGSLSPMTALQVEVAGSYQKVWLDAGKLVSEATYLGDMATHIAGQLRQGLHVLACTARYENTRQPDSSRPATDARALALACGELLAQVLKQQPVKRLGIAGGDTSSHAIQALDAWGLSYKAQLAPGVALCCLHSDDANLDGMEVMLKGGQMGSESLFEDLLTGSQHACS